MKRKLLSLALLASSAFAVTVPRPAGEVFIQTSATTQELLSAQKGKVVVLAFILTT
jgi:hypothetical protein